MLIKVLRNVRFRTKITTKTKTKNFLHLLSNRSILRFLSISSNESIKNLILMSWKFNISSFNILRRKRRKRKKRKQFKQLHNLRLIFTIIWALKTINRRLFLTVQRAHFFSKSLIFELVSELNTRIWSFDIWSSRIIKKRFSKFFQNSQWRWIW